jgi:hypothetical protein
MGKNNLGSYAGCLHSMRIVVFLSFFLVLSVKPAFPQDSFDVVRNKWLIYSDISNSLYQHLTSQAIDLLKKRSQKVSAIKTPEEWKERQLSIKNTLLDIVGPFPEKTPLNALIVRIIDKGSYRIEHIIYESQPGFLVTSSLFIPSDVRKSSRLPAIIYCSGHSEEGYRSAVYLHTILNLVDKGFIVFAFDPVGQGERLEYFDPETGKSKAGGPTREHSQPGAQAFLTGSSQARYMIWDGIRALDYLLSRKEVDPARIGITGRSGGGTQSAYIAAFDDRIYAAAPENYLTNFTRLLQTIGPQDAEQNLFNLISRGLDHPDFLIVRAPKPALIITTSDDMFSIQGAIETEKEVAEVYKAFGSDDNFSRVEDNAQHASTKKNREAMYSFFLKHLSNQNDPADKEIPIPEPEELMVTTTGQLSTSIGSETVFSLNKGASVKQGIKLDQLRNNSDDFNQTVLIAARRLSGYIDPISVGDPVFTGRVIRNGYTIEKYFVKGEGDYLIPYLLFLPDTKSEQYLIYLNPSGKSAESLPGGEIEKLVRNGYIVLAPDLLGMGEMGNFNSKGDATFEGISHNIWYAAMLIGRSIAGIQAGDIARLVLIIKRRSNNAVISGFAREEMTPALLHAAAFNKSIGSVILVNPYSSYSSIVLNRFYNHKYIPSTVPGALEYYDLPDLAASLAPARLIIAGIKDGKGKYDDTGSITKSTDIIKNGYECKNATENLVILPDGYEEDIYRITEVNR